MSISAWLQELGLERYIEAFETHDIDTRTLPLLTESDLAEIGVKSVGHRRKLAAAIAALGASSAALGEATAEHRQLTVLYCDMTAAAARPAPSAEDMREVIQAFHKTCTRVVTEFDGHVANFYGDCLLAYFGWPRAHEDDPERAVRAGLALMRQIAALATSGPSLSSRVGIATGDVVVGDLIREGPAQAQSAVGLTPNLGARLLTLAASGQVVVDELTRQLLPSTFLLRSLGRHVLKGIREPVTAYAVGGEQLVDSRFDARQGEKLAPMIGREQELSLLLERWVQARGGEGQAVLLVGEAGIGKSRLTRALLDACARGPHVTVRWQCSPYHAGSALWPVIQRLGRASGVGADDSNDVSLDKLEALVGPDGAEAAALYATLLGLNGTQRYGPLELTPQMLRERTLELLLEQLFDMADERALLLVVEDAHWIDPSTRELIERCLERIASARMLILITSRPDNQPQLGAHPSVARLSLNRLSRASVQAIVAQLGGAGLNPQTLATIAAQADGVPLFAEELTKAVLETGEAAIPASLHGSLMARLDRIPEVKEVAQIAACIGREFDRALVQAVAERPEAVGAALDKLAAAELVFRRGDSANPRFIFKHALVQEAAYESLLRGRRQSLHARLLELLEATRHETPPDILAHHAERAGRVDPAVGYWRHAGDAALAKSAYHEAIAYLDNAVGLIQAQGDAVDRRGPELELQLALGQARIAAHGHAAEATRKAFTRARELLESKAGGSEHGVQLQVQYGLWVWHMNRAEFRESLRLAADAFAAAPANSDDEARLCVLRLIATSHMYLGEFARAQGYFEQAMPLLDTTARSEPMALTVIDPEVATLCCFAIVLCIQGCAEQGGVLMARAQSLGPGLPQASVKAHLHMFCALQAACMRDTAAMRHHVASLAALADRHRLTMHSGYADVLQSWLTTTAPNEDAIAVCKRGLGKLEAAGSRIYAPFFLAHLATLLAASGHQDEAIRTIDEALAECEDTAQGWCEAELWRVRGEILLRERERDGAQAVGCFERALRVARGRNARLWELRAAVSLARLRAERGEHAKALSLLGPAYDSFTEGFDTVDLVEARTLLGSLGRREVRPLR